MGVFGEWRTSPRADQWPPCVERGKHPFAAEWWLAMGKQKSNRADVARSLRELEILFGKKSPPEKENAAGKSGKSEQQSKLPAHDSTVLKPSQGVRHG